MKTTTAALPAKVPAAWKNTDFPDGFSSVRRTARTGQTGFAALQRPCSRAATGPFLMNEGQAFSFRPLFGKGTGGGPGKTKSGMVSDDMLLYERQ